jgi:hypothetical protein
MTSHVYRVMLMNRYRFARPSESPDIGVYWAYGAKDKPPGVAWAFDANGRCRDISKTHVESLHVEVFGYGAGVDPNTYHGDVFVKSNDNALHDGRIVRGPIADPQPDTVYQRAIRNTQPDGTREDIRVPVVGAHIPFVYLVYRRLGDRIGGREMGRTRLIPVEAALGADEVDVVLRLCQRIGLDFGELDILRDQGDGRIYVVDVNRAVGSFVQPKEMTSRQDYWRHLATIADLFDDTFHRQ